MPRKQPKHHRKGKIKREPPVFGADNYKLMAGAGALIFVGFAIMAIENEISGFFSLYVSPILIIAGFILFGFGIIRKKEDVRETTSSENR